MIRLKWLMSLRASSPLSETIIASGFFILCFAILLPDLFFLVKSPMGGDGDALKDPAVSFAVFMPAFREFRYELLEHGNILWSNLRGMGLPILGNGVQGAPLFPLNLVLLWLPDPLYWSVMPIARVILIALGTYLLARRVFGLSIVAGLVFAMLVGFNVNIIRWINHPWLNGILAGVWYLYFCCSVFALATAKRSSAWLHCVGLVVSVFAMVTCGFPEASAVAAIFTAVCFTAFVVTGWSRYQESLKDRLLLLALCHLVGFCLSAVQSFALFEFVEMGQVKELRQSFIGATFRPDQALPFWLAQFTQFWHSDTQHQYLNFYTGLFGMLFFLRGLVLWPRMTEKLWVGVAFLCLMLLYIVKSFGLVQLVEIAFSKIPVLNQSHFPLYFSPLFYMGFGYFVALGVESLFRQATATRKQKLLDIAVSISATVGILLLAAFTIKYFNKFDWHRFIEKFNSQEVMHLRFFIIGAVLVNLYLVISLSAGAMAKLTRRSAFLSPLAGGLLIAWLFIEIHGSLFRGFSRPDYWTLNLNGTNWDTIERAVAAAPVARHELRGNDPNGNYVGHGVATINNGISAILPADQRLLRTKYFYSEFGGYYPIEKAARPWAWESTSSNFVIIKTTARGIEDWSRRSLDPEIYPKVMNWPEVVNIARTTPFILSGSVRGLFKDILNVHPWIHFKGERQEFWVHGNIAKQRNLGPYKDRFNLITDWRLRIPNEWLQEDSYRVTVRQTSGELGGYADIAAVTLNLTPMEPAGGPPYKFSEFPDMTDSTLLAAAPDESLHIYFNHKALPRAYIASGCERSEAPDSAIKFLTESDAVVHGHVMLTETQDHQSVPCHSYSAKFSRVPVIADHGNNLQLDSVTGPALLVVNDYIYPGWTAVDQISGQEFEIVRANSLSRAIYLPANQEYKLKLSYRPWWLNIVYALLILALVATVLGWRWMASNGGSKSDEKALRFFA